MALEYYSEYSLDTELNVFFGKTSATRHVCDTRARELTGGKVIPVEVQGSCSYSVYAGPALEYVVQFRLKSLSLKIDIAMLASEIHASFAPKVSFEGKIGDDGEKEPLHVYLMGRLHGITHLDFILANGFPEHSADNLMYRRNLMGDIAHFMALSWKSPRPVSPEYRNALRQSFSNDLSLLHTALPVRFQPIIQICLDALDDILALPMVLLHRDLGASNILVDELTCHLLHYRNGWTRYKDYDSLQNLFWEKFQHEVGGLSGHQIRTIKLARALGLLLSSGFTSRLANQPLPVPIGDDEYGCYKLLSLDFLVNPETRFDGLEYSDQ